MSSFFILEFLPRQSLDHILWKMTFGKTFGWSLSISMCMQNCTEIFQKVQEIGPVLLLSKSGPWQSIDRWQKAFLPIPWARSSQYKCFCKISPKNLTRFKNLCFIWKYHVSCPNLCCTWKYDVFSEKWCYIENVICVIECYIRKCVTNMRCVLSEFMLHTHI